MRTKNAFGLISFFSFGLICTDLFGANPVLQPGAVNLAPIVKHGTSGESLNSDPILPKKVIELDSESTDFTLERSLLRSSDLPILNFGTRGNLIQPKGFGLASEEVDVQAFGFSLSPPQGGGFDFTSFPTFLWGNVEVRKGPALNQANPVGGSALLALQPWTTSALEAADSENRSSGTAKSAKFGSSAHSQGYQELYAGFASRTLEAGGIAGVSFGEIQGTSGMVTQGWQIGRYHGAFHTLATDQTANTSGPTSFPSPGARVKKARVIPVLQTNYDFTERLRVLNTISFDWGRLNYEDPNSGFQTADFVRQLGTETSVQIASTKIGASYRATQYASSYLNWPVPLQHFAHLQISSLIDTELGTALFTLDPTLQLLWHSDFGWFPVASLGFKHEEIAASRTDYMRLSAAPRLPSLLDRYGSSPDFRGNPNMKPENNLTALLGSEWKPTHKLKFQIESFFQYKSPVRVSLPSTLINLDEAWLASVSGYAQADLEHGLEFSLRPTLSASRVIGSAQSYPYLPVLANLVRLNYVPLSTRLLCLGIQHRVYSSQVRGVGTGEEVPGYGVIDLDLKLSPFPSAGRLQLNLAVDNLFDRNLEILKGYPTARTWSLGVTAQL